MQLHKHAEKQFKFNDNTKYNNKFFISSGSATNTMQRMLHASN